MTHSASPARRLLLRLLVAVAALHAGAIALYYTLDIPRAAPPWQRSFAWTWLGLTCVVVVIGLRRLRQTRTHRVAHGRETD